METADNVRDARQNLLRCQLIDRKSAIQPLKLRENADARTRDEYSRLRAVGARDKRISGI